MLTIQFFLATWAIAAPVPKPIKKVTGIEVVVNSTHIKLCDPLLALVVVQCGDGTQITVKEAVSFRWNSVHFELCEPQKKDYRRTLAVGQGGGCGYSPPMKLANGESARCFGTLHGGEKNSPFNSVGVWKLRVAVSCESGQLYSDPIHIEVKERSAAGLAALRECDSSILNMSNAGWYIKSDILDSLRTKVLAVEEESNVKTFVMRYSALSKLPMTDAEEEFRKAWAEVEKSCKTASAIEQEYVKIEAIKMLLHKDKLATAERLLKTLLEKSEEYEMIVATIEDKRNTEKYRKKPSK